MTGDWVSEQTTHTLTPPHTHTQQKSNMYTLMLCGEGLHTLVSKFALPVGMTVRDTGAVLMCV